MVESFEVSNSKRTGVTYTNENFYTVLSAYPFKLEIDGNAVQNVLTQNSEGNIVFSALLCFQDADYQECTGTQTVCTEETNETCEEVVTSTCTVIDGNETCEESTTIECTEETIQTCEEVSTPEGCEDYLDHLRCTKEAVFTTEAQYFKPPITTKQIEDGVDRTVGLGKIQNFACSATEICFEDEPPILYKQCDMVDEIDSTYYMVG